MQQLSSRGRSARCWSGKLIQAAILLLTLGFVLPSSATLVSGSGAGTLPGTALDLSGIHGAFTIAGSLDQSAGVAVFKIDVTDYQDFSAQTVLPSSFGINDTELFLFDAAGLGVYGNDDIDFSNPLSCLPSAGASNPCPTGRNGLGPTSNGIYYLAMAYSLNGPLDGSSNPIFLPGVDSTSILGPDASVGAVAGWDGNIFTSPDFDNNKYLIQVTGVPEPSTLLLVSPGLFLGWLRRKQLFQKKS